MKTKTTTTTTTTLHRSFFAASILVCLGLAAPRPAPATPPGDSPSLEKMTLDYCVEMNRPKPLIARRGEDFKKHQRELRKNVLRSIGLWPLPERVPLDIHESEPLDHPWCTVRRVHYQLWPGVYSSGLLYMPKELPEKPAPAVLCPHGHWPGGNTNSIPQTRCLYFSRKGYVIFSPVMHHYEDLNLGVSHQTQMVWNNMRALDYLESLPMVDRERIGCVGCSGGAMQTLMIVGLDSRVKAASIVGWGGDFHEALYPTSQHCGCHQFPNIMRFTDHPEISALGMPAAIQHLTMNDTTRNFKRDNFPAIKKLYAANGVAERVDCEYWSIGHSFHKPMRERAYWWIDRWLRGIQITEPQLEPDVQVFDPAILKELKATVPEDSGIPAVSSVYRRVRGYKVPTISSRTEWESYRRRMQEALRELLGEAAESPTRVSDSKTIGSEEKEGVAIERLFIPSEGNFLVPTVILRRANALGKLPVVVICHEAGQDSLLGADSPESPIDYAKNGSLVVLPDLRYTGKLGSARNWARNTLPWGRPVAGFGYTDLRKVLDALAKRADADMTRVEVIARGSGSVAVAVLFTAALDARIASVDVDLAGTCFEKRNLPVVPFVLQHGDILQWAALLADRQLTLRNVPAQTGDPAWLAGVFKVLGNGSSLKIEKQKAR